MAPTSTTRRITLPILVISAAFVFLFAASPCRAQPVLDSDGDEVVAGGIYKIKLVGTGSFGGVTILPPPAGTAACWRPVGPGEKTDTGMPLMIIPGSPDLAPDGILRESVRSRIEFLTSSHLCVEPGYWTSIQLNSTKSGQFTAIVTGREQGSPPETGNWIEVRESGKKRAYKLIFCDTCLGCKIFCSETIGTFKFNGNTVLGVGGKSVSVRFDKVSKGMPAAAVAAA